MEPPIEPPIQPPPMRSTPKFSRYKSVRRAAAEKQAQEEGTMPVPPGSAPKPQSDTIARSMSRYRRPRTATTGTAAIDTPPLPALPTPNQIPQPINKTSHVVGAQTSTGSYETKTTPVHHSCPEGASSNGINEVHKDEAIRGMNRGGLTGVRVDWNDEEELSEVEKAKLREEAMRTLTMAERPKTASRAPMTSQQAYQDSHYKAMESKRELAHQDNEHKRASWKDKLGFSRHKTSAGHSRPEDKAGSETKKGNIEPNGRGIVPGIDAPLSAVNAGERRVLIKCQSLSITLPVTPTTRAKDLIYSAVNCFSERIDPKTAIILESFSSLGLERPLRRYEHIREVMNSWATDDANPLLITESPYEGASERFELKAAPSAQPGDATFYLYYSSKPGKWDKRYVTMRADGQVVISKKSNAKEAKDYSNICHLSDFDIYTPTDHQLSKKLRPPKKICFAIKSQQKSSMFISTENFVHFFATNDSELAQKWYDAVHGWRSWYLVRVVKLSEKHQEAIQSNQPVGDVHDTSRHRHMSTESVPYQLGSFRPLVDFGRNADPDVDVSDKRSAEHNGSTSTRDMFLRKKKTRDYAPPPSAFPITLSKLETGSGSFSEQDDDSTFSPDSLLGRVYSQRQAAQREREAREAQENDAFTSHGLLKNLSPTSNPSSHNMPFSNPSTRHTSRSNTVRSHHHPEGTSYSRSNSVRQKPKPLVDLTPVYREPPQHARKGHGVKIQPGVPLVEAATGLEPIPGVPEIPSATTWRRPPTANGSSAASIAPRRANTIRSQQPGEYPTSPDFPFMPNGLVSLSGHSPSIGYATTGVGRGIATGDRYATRPLLDMAPTSQFAEGSLLRNMERGM